jgi:hypothetical protein
VPNEHEMYYINGHKISQMSVKCSKWPKNMSPFSNRRSSKNYPNWQFWFENKPTGNPATKPEAGSWIGFKIRFFQPCGGETFVGTGDRGFESRRSVRFFGNYEGTFSLLFWKLNAHCYRL